MSNLLINQLREKRNWSILTGVILLITVVIVPMLMNSDLHEGHIVIGIFEVFLIVFVNTIIDFNYMHDQRKFGYYLSKPVRSIKRINIILLANMMFATFFMILLWFIAAFNHLELYELFIFPSAWLFIIILLSGLSSILTGNSIVAAIVTWFNFGLPIFLLGVVYFIVETLSNLAVGLNTYSIMDYFIEEIYRIDIIYFFKFISEVSWVGYFTTLIIISSIIYGLIILLNKRRLNEKIGEYLIFYGYKYFIALLLSTLVTYLFSLILNDNEFIARILSFIILGSVTYYVVLVILEKSFRHKAFVYKLLAVFMVFFVVSVSLAGFIIKKAESHIPEISEIRGIFISNGEHIYLEEKEHSIRVSELEWEDRQNPEVNIYTSNAAITNLTSLHKELIRDHRYNNYVSFNMVYFLKDGTTINRYFEVKYEDEDYNTQLEVLSKEFEKLDEYKQAVMPVLYDPIYESIALKLDIYTQGTVTLELSTDEFKVLKEALIKDIEYIIDNSMGSLSALTNYGGYFNVYRDMKVVEETKEVRNDYYGIRIYSNEFNQHIDINEHFINTKPIIQEYLDRANK